jgi:prepilin-type N-terminal cleavage/methylation domain-containing protein
MNPHRRLAGEDGVTLIELLTAMTVAGLVLAFVTGTVIQALQTQRRETAQIAALNDAKLAFERTTRDIRAADPLEQVAPDRIQLDVLDRSATMRTVTYERIGAGLVVTVAGGGTPRTLVGNLAAQPLFLFHLADGSTVTGDPAIDPSLVRSVTVRLRVEPPGAGRVVDLENRVLVRNATS